MEIKLNLKFIKLKDHFNAFFVAKFPVIRKIEVVPKEVFSHDMGFFTVCEDALNVFEIIWICNVFNIFLEQYEKNDAIEKLFGVDS